MEKNQIDLNERVQHFLVKLAYERLRQGEWAAVIIADFALVGGHGFAEATRIVNAAEMMVDIASLPEVNA